MFQAIAKRPLGKRKIEKNSAIGVKSKILHFIREKDNLDNTSDDILYNGWFIVLIFRFNLKSGNQSFKRGLVHIFTE